MARDYAFFSRLYAPYFRLSIHQRIDERQHRNALNINFLFATVLRGCTHSQYKTAAPENNFPPVNCGTYHKYGKRHSQYPKPKA